jgi:hypothetical protein
MKRVLVLCLLSPLPALAQQPHEQEIQRALIELDRRGHQAKALEPHAGRPLHPDPEIARQLRPYERMKAAEERDVHVLRLPPPVVPKDEKPLPLPGRPQAGVDPVTVPRSAN